MTENEHADSSPMPALEIDGAVLKRRNRTGWAGLAACLGGAGIALMGVYVIAGLGVACIIAGLLLCAGGYSLLDATIDKGPSK